ncbi:MAG: type II toxin-antitoxin system RelE/ParE family toxin [Brachymonas sp.]|nr:type II toxin-antitoxin system RelE/ParE family toxin [Brachymonas sp.]
MELRNYVGLEGRDYFAAWFAALDPQARAKVTIHLVRMKNGNMSNVKGVDEGVLEKRIDWGPGYRVYFGMDGNALVILLGGGSKAKQDQDIEHAHERWREYKRRKKE